MCCCWCNSNQVTPLDDGRCDVVVLGSEGLGKTLLIRQLQAVHDRDKRKQFHTRTFPTTGVEIHIVKTKGPGSVKHLRARELGGCMQPIWHKYYEDADALLYVLSVTQTHEQWQAAGAQLRDILDHPDMQGKPCLVLLNQCDEEQCVQPDTLARVEAAIDWSALRTQRKACTELVAVSAACNRNIDKIMKWLVQFKSEARIRSTSAP